MPNQGVKMTEQPASPEEVVYPPLRSAFRTARWVRAGATPEQLTTLETEFSTLTPEAQAEESTRVDEGSDFDLVADLAARGGPGASVPVAPRTQTVLDGTLAGAEAPGSGSGGEDPTDAVA